MYAVNVYIARFFIAFNCYLIVSRIIILVSLFFCN